MQSLREANVPVTFKVTRPRRDTAARTRVRGGVAYWRNVPARVWDYFIGGYQVIKKWLSYREAKLLGRGLRLDEAKYVTEMVRRLAALRLLEPALDANYETVKADTYPFPPAEPRG